MLTFVYFATIFLCGFTIGSVLSKNGIEFADFEFWLVVIAYGATIGIVSNRAYFLPEALL